MSETKPLSTCSVSKNDVVAMAHGDASLEHVIKLEEVDLKPDYIECNSDGYREMTDMNEHTDNGDVLVDSPNDDSSLFSNMDVYVKEEIISQHNNDESEMYQDEEIKFHKQDTEVKPEIDTKDGVIPLNEHGIPNDLNTEMKMEQTEESETNIYLTEVSNKKNNQSNKVAKGKNKYKPKLKSYTKSKLNKTPKTYVCNDCPYKSVHRGTFITHLRLHTGEKPYLCTYCGNSYAKKYYMTQHLNIHTGEKPYLCTFCGSKYAIKSILTKHLRIHTGEKPFLCSYCDYKSTQKVNLREHLRRHNGEKPFSCKFCEYKCTTSSILKIHIRRHTGEKPYSCPSCQYKSASKTQLTNHSSIHASEKPFSCEFCEYKSVRKLSLKRHLIKHKKPSNAVMVKEVTDESDCVDDMTCREASNKTNEVAESNKQHSSLNYTKNISNKNAKTYSCNDCPYKSVYRGTCIRHLRQHTGEKPYLCTYCGYKCKQKAHLTRHLRIHNGEKRDL